MNSGTSSLRRRGIRKVPPQEEEGDEPGIASGLPKDCGRREPHETRNARQSRANEVAVAAEVVGPSWRSGDGRLVRFAQQGFERVEGGDDDLAEELECKVDLCLTREVPLDLEVGAKGQYSAIERTQQRTLTSLAS